MKSTDPLASQEVHILQPGVTVRPIWGSGAARKILGAEIMSIAMYPDLTKATLYIWSIQRNSASPLPPPENFFASTFDPNKPKDSSWEVRFKDSQGNPEARDRCSVLLELFIGSGATERILHYFHEFFSKKEASVPVHLILLP